MDDMYFNNSDSGCDRDNSNKNESQGGNGSIPANFFYTESCKKAKSRRTNNLLQLVLVALISSIIGGGVVFAGFQFVAPAIRPTINSYFSNLLPGRNAAANSNSNSGITYKKVEIERTDSPVTAIAEKVSPSIVGIRVTTKVRDFFFGESEGTGEGSGIIATDDGYIITNYHVIMNALDRSGKQSSEAKVEVFLPNMMDKPYTAKIVGTDARTDLAVIKIEGTGFHAAEFGNSDELKVGEMAVAIGNPGGLEYMGSVTVGVISGLNRTVKADGGREFKLIQTDAAINPGNSGGALVNSRGQVIGVASLKVVSQAFEGIGFAIPSNTVKEITDSLIKHQYVKGRPFIGISADLSYNEEAAKFYNAPVGVLVQQVIPFTGAYKAGIQPGDIIMKFNGKPVKNINELNELKDKHKPGDKVSLEIYRDGETLTVELTLTEDKN